MIILDAAVGSVELEGHQREMEASGHCFITLDSFGRHSYPKCI